MHRPPRPTRTSRPRTPHCEWTVMISSHPEPVGFSDGCLALQPSRAATIVAGSDRPVVTRALRLLGTAAGRPRLRGLLALSARADRRRGLPADAPAVPGFPPGRLVATPCREARRDLREAAHRDRGGRGVATRLALWPAASAEGASRVLELHPLFNPAAYVADRRLTATHRPTRTAPGSRSSGPRAPPAPRDRAGDRAHLDVVVSGSPGPSRWSSSAGVAGPSPTRSPSPGSAPARPSPSSRGGRCRSRRCDGAG